ncbi:MAG: hypothetical protein ACPIOQ_31235, partial [Promethearchaeia archaeon]
DTGHARAMRAAHAHSIGLWHATLGSKGDRGEWTCIAPNALHPSDESRPRLMENPNLSPKRIPWDESRPRLGGMS